MNKQIKVAKIGRRVQLALVASVGVVSGSAMAAIPAEATTAITGLATDGGSMVAAGWPILVGVTGGLVLMGIFKKVLGRAT